MRAETWPDSSTARTTRTAYESPPQNFCTPATMAAAADLCPPPVSDEMIRIFGALGRDIAPRVTSGFDGESVRPLFISAELLARLLHLALKALDLDEVLRVEGERRVVAIRLVRAEAAGGHLLAPRLHRLRAPERLEVPVVLAQVPDRRLVLAGGDRALVVDDRAGRAR